MPVSLVDRGLRANLTSLALVTTLCLSGCGAGAGPAKWPETTQKWFDRAELSYRHGDLDDAEHATLEALRSLPKDPKLRLMGARIALARLDFAKAIELSQGIEGADARGIRGRAYWYSNDLTLAAKELGELAKDPDVHDPWATEIAELARSGQGRKPFEMSGGLLAAIEMPRSGSSAMIVQLEVNGEPCLALVATDSPETVIDSPDKRGTWLSLRFGGALEVNDVPALGRDLAGIKRELNAPIKLLIGVNLLRHLRPTIDFAARQFVVRSFDPPAPPEATTLHPVYYRGGAIVLPVAYGSDDTSPLGALMMHTSMTFPVALDEAAWKKAGENPSAFAPIAGRQGLREGLVSSLRLGTFELNGVPGVYGAGVAEAEKAAEADLDGFAGSGLFATLRLTLTDSGRTLWLEDLPPEVLAMQRAPRPAPPSPALFPGGPSADTAPPGSPPGAPPASSPPVSAPPVLKPPVRKPPAPQKP
jgi:hypothetical protein